MPTYEYECTACGQHIEVFQRISADPLSTCGVCGGPLRKVFHPVGIVFKGSGFYATDNRSANQAAGAEKKADAAGAPSGGSEKATGTASGEGAGSSKAGSAKEPSSS
jgi:putative FmdB family regulatory protein